MQQTKSLCLSDLIRDPNAVIRDFNEIPDDNSIEYIREYGIGIDCHSKFIEVCIRYRNGNLIQKAQAHFSTNWDDLVAAQNWCVNILKTKADPVPDLSDPLHYLVESTANYYMPVCMAWGGHPTMMEGSCPILIPMEVRIVLRDEYEKFDPLTALAEEYKSKILDKARSMEWETDTGSLPGNEMIRILATARR